MGNHCVNGICMECGASWCMRGCNYDSGPSKERLAQFVQNENERAAKYNQKPHFLKATDERCDYCSSDNVVHC